jgi:GTP-binding protein
LLNAVFFTTVARLADLPRESAFEVAFAGRSNAGKSSAINALAHHKRLAFVSKTPGRTQHINFFQVGEQRFLVDLPGYGFAKAPLAQQNTWQRLIGGYLMQRPQIAGLVLIMDIRHPFTALDEQMLQWYRTAGRPVLVLLSKADKLSRGARLATLAKARAWLAREAVDGLVLTFSSVSREGVDEAETCIRAWLDMAKKSPAQGDKPGHEVLNCCVKAPAQGGEAGDDAIVSGDKKSGGEKSSQEPD